MATRRKWFANLTLNALKGLDFMGRVADGEGFEPSMGF